MPDHVFIQKIKHRWNVYKTRFKFQKIDKLDIPNIKNEIRLFAIARNESLRLPYFLKYYFGKGVDRIFLIDNNSSDNTREIALTYPNIHVFKIDEGYKNHWNWMEYFLDKFATDHWSLVVDIDELLSYPYSENISIKELTKYLESNKYNALHSLLLDIYSDKPIINTIYCQDENPLVCCPYFDPKYYALNMRLLDLKKWTFFNATAFFGGMRERVFPNIYGSRQPVNISKISLFKYTADLFLIQGMHALNGANFADIQGAVLHTKFMHDFNNRVAEETIREEHWGNAVEYKIYNQECLRTRNLALKFPGSVKYENTQQLIKLSIMRTSDNYNAFFGIQ